MKTKHTPLPEIAPVPWDASGGYVYDANGKQVHLYAERQRIVRACNAHADLLAALEGLLAEMVNPVHVHHRSKYAEYQISPESITAARAALAKAGRGVEGGGEC